MADAPAGASIDVGDRVERWLVANTEARPLNPGELTRCLDGTAVRGWRITVDIAGTPVELDLSIDRRFPRSRPDIAFAVPPPFPSYPHVEEDGGICAIEQSDELDPGKPIGIIKAVLGAAVDVLEKGFSGANADDFRTEFLSYWIPTTSGDPVYSLLDPCGGTRRVKVRHGRSGLYVAEDRPTLFGWLANRYDVKLGADQACRAGLLLWFDQPLLPQDYPTVPADLAKLAASIGEAAALDAFMSIDQASWLVLLGAPAETGACFAAVLVERQRRHGWSAGKGKKGFRKGKVPAQVVLAEAHEGTAARRRVRRVDPRWVHGRDGNADLEPLLATKVVMVGCGSLGAPVARLLAQAGIGDIDLVDPEVLDEANVGRHVLGSGEIGQNKAKALALRLQRDFPHASFTGHAESWQKAVASNPGLLTNADLVISTIGSWSHEGELNEAQLEDDPAGTTLYAWSEPHAVAGHAVLIGPSGGCLACGLAQDGRALFRAGEFPQPTLQREPACGGHFQPYGAAEITLIATMTAQLALDHLLGRAPAGTYRIVSALDAAMAASGGTWTAQWADATGGRPGGTTIERGWQHDLACPACRARER